MRCFIKKKINIDEFKNKKDWEARLLIERSHAIKSPNMQTHLVGAKRIQKALAEPDAIEKYIQDKEMVQKIRATFVEQFSFDVIWKFYNIH